MRIVLIPPGSNGGTIAALWLTARKQPGKICRPRQFRHRGGKRARAAERSFASDVNGLHLRPRVAQGSHSQCRSTVMGGSAFRKDFWGAWDVRHPDGKVFTAGGFIAFCRTAVASAILPS